VTPAPSLIVHVVEDDDSLRLALASLLRASNLAVALYKTAEEFLESCALAEPGCILLDVNLPGRSGVDLQARLRATGCDLPIVFLTGHGTIPMTVQAMRAGAVEFLTKPFSAEDLLHAIQRAGEQGRVAWLARRAEADLRERYSSLSPRQREVFALVAAGQMNKVIAADLGITEITVKVHRRQVMERLEVRTLADLVRAAERLGVSAAGPSAQT